jgi:hypothetical protein
MNATMTDTWIVRRTFGPVPIDGYGHGATITATAGLHQIGGNDRPYWSVTAEVVTPASNHRRDIEAGGCMHDEILQHFPELAPVVALHLADDTGTPMHALANALFHAGVGKYSEENAQHLASHFRVPLMLAESWIRIRPIEHRQEAIERHVAESATKWQAESDAAKALLAAL